MVRFVQVAGWLLAALLFLSLVIWILVDPAGGAGIDGRHLLLITVAFGGMWVAYVKGLL